MFLFKNLCFTTIAKTSLITAITAKYSVSKNQYTRLLIITSANLDRFTKLFHCQIPEEVNFVHNYRK